MDGSRQLFIRQGGTDVQGPFAEERIRHWIDVDKLHPGMEFSADGVHWRYGFELPDLFQIAEHPEISSGSEIDDGARAPVLRGGPRRDRSRRLRAQSLRHESRPRSRRPAQGRREPDHAARRARQIVNWMAGVMFALPLIGVLYTVGLDGASVWTDSQIRRCVPDEDGGCAEFDSFGGLWMVHEAIVEPSDLPVEVLPYGEKPFGERAAKKRSTPDVAVPQVMVRVLPAVEKLPEGRLVSGRIRLTIDTVDVVRVSRRTHEVPLSFTPRRPGLGLPLHHLLVFFCEHMVACLVAAWALFLLLRYILSRALPLMEPADASPSETAVVCIYTVGLITLGILVTGRLGGWDANWWMGGLIGSLLHPVILGFGNFIDDMQ